MLTHNSLSLRSLSIVSDGQPSTGSAVQISKWTKKLPQPIVDELKAADDYRTRILTRVEDHTACVKSVPKENVSPIEKCLDTSEAELNNLRRFGEELITNLKVANEKRELLRRKAEEEQKSSLVSSINDEATTTLAKFDEIVARWSELEDLKEPMALYEALEDQKENKAQLMASKDVLIKNLQEEQNRLNEQFQAEQNRNEIDVCCLVERVDNQIEIMNQAYKDHLQILISTIDEERKFLSEKAMNDWDKLYTNMIEGEEKTHLVKREKNKIYEDELNRIKTEQEELTRATRIRLEKDAEMLQLELRIAQNNALLNSEKLDYNYNILQKRTYENTIIFNQQKRRISKLTENITQMRRKIDFTKAQSDAVIQKLVTEIEKLHVTISNLEKKYYSLQKCNKEQFYKIWDMNYEEVTQLMESLQIINQALHEQILLLPWEPIEFTENPLKKSKKKEKEFSCENSVKTKPKRTETEKIKTPDDMSETRLIRHLLRSIADRTGFVIEEAVLEILKPYYEKHQNLIKLNAVLKRIGSVVSLNKIFYNFPKALKLNNMNDIRAMIKYFKPYMYCPNCQRGVSDNLLKKIYGTCSTLDILKEEPNPLNEDDFCSNHYLVMEPALVLTALSNLTENKKQEIERYSAAQQPTLSKIPLTEQEIKSFWDKLANCIPESDFKLWKSIEHALNHYIDVLRKRAELYKECEFLKKQNLELKHLVQKFTN